MGARVFEDKPAVRERTPLLVGLMGPSGSGKTYSALRLATGIQRVSGGDIYVIDTEASRSKHYADTFKFRHVPFSPPFGPLDYLAALEHCISKKAGVIVVDSMSHEHEGPGGVLEMHEQEVQRMAGNDYAKRERIKMFAWGKPKQERRRLINSILQMNANFIFCFRAKEKVKMPSADDKKSGQTDPIPLGFMPIAGEEFIYEMTINALLYPGSNGVPTWKTNAVGERLMMKLPAQFRGAFDKPLPLSEDLGRYLAAWAEGTKSTEFEAMARRIADAGSVGELEKLVPELTGMKEKKVIPGPEYKALREAYGERLHTLEEYARTNPDDVEPSDLPHDPETGEVTEAAS
jgi:hypothetical protein